MARKPFLIQVPEKYTRDPEEKAFWDYMLRYITDTQLDTDRLNSDLSDELNEIYGNNPDVVVSDDNPSDQLVTVGGNDFLSREQVGGTQTAIGGEFIHAYENATINLEDNPTNGALVKVGNADGSTITIRGRGTLGFGRTVQFTTTSTTQGAVYDYRFSTTVNAWLIV